MFQIGDFSRLTHVTVKALRHYDRLGLLTPLHVAPATGYRFYSAAQLPRLNRLLALKDLGLSLEQIGPFLDAELSAEQLRALLLVKQAEISRQLEADEARLARIDARLRQLQDGDPGYDVVVKPVGAQRVASLRGTLPDRSAIRTLFQQLSAYQQRYGLTSTSWMAIWHDPDFREADIDAEATFATADPLPPDHAIRERELPKIETMASIVHQGAPGTISRACMSLLGWIEANGYQVAGSERVRQLERGWPESIVELQIPVARARASAGSIHDHGSEVVMHRGARGTSLDAQTA